MKPERTSKSSRKLKDYPPVPSTPPPTDRKDKGLLHLEEELDHEKKYLAALCVENKELEEIIEDFDKEIAYVRSNFPQQIAGDGKVHASNDFWFRYESQMEVNRKLEREKKHLLNDIRQIEEQGMVNLDSLSQSELILYVKQLERTKTDLLSDLRSKEWGLDKTAKVSERFSELPARDEVVPLLQDIHHLNEMKRALQAEIRHYDKEFALFRHYKKNSCPSASPTGSRLSSVTDEKRLKMLKQKPGDRSDEQEDVIPDKRTSLSQENVAGDIKSDVMFSSLDESKLERMECESPTPGLQRKSVKVVMGKKKVSDGKKGSIKKTIASLPELPKTKSPSPRAFKTKRGKPEKVGSESPKPQPGNQTASKPIKIIVTYETQTTTVTEKTIAGEEGGRSAGEGGREERTRSPEEVYEDDFEDSDVDKYQDRNVGFLTTRV